MSDKAQQRLLTILSIVISIGLSQPLTRFIAEKIPERRGIRDDVTEAVLQGAGKGGRAHARLRDRAPDSGQQEVERGSYSQRGGT